MPPGDARAQYPGRLLAELVADHFGVAIPVAVGAAPAGRTPIVVGEASAGVVAAAARAAAPVPAAAEGYLLSIDAGARWSRAATTAARSTVSPPSSSSSTAGATKRRRARGARARLAVPPDPLGAPLPAGQDQLDFARRTMRDVLLRYKFNGIVLEVGGAMRLDSHPEISVGWKRTVAEWYAHGETMDALGEGIPLGTANRFAASLHVGVGGGRTSRRTT